MSTTECLNSAEKSACVLLSDLFLDCEMMQIEIDCMARNLHCLQIPIKQIDNLLRNDVFPVLFINLLCITGIWDAFDENDLIDQITSRRRQPSIVQTLGNNIAWMIMSWLVTSRWVEVKEKICELDSVSLHDRKDV